MISGLRLLLCCRRKRREWIGGTEVGGGCRLMVYCPRHNPLSSQPSRQSTATCHHPPGPALLVSSGCPSHQPQQHCPLGMDSSDAGPAPHAKPDLEPHKTAGKSHPTLQRGHCRVRSPLQDLAQVGRNQAGVQFPTAGQHKKPCTNYQARRQSMHAPEDSRPAKRRKSSGASTKGGTGNLMTHDDVGTDASMQDAAASSAAAAHCWSNSAALASQQPSQGSTLCPQHGRSDQTPLPKRSTSPAVRNAQSHGHGPHWREDMAGSGDAPSCSRATPYNRNLRRGHREPDAIAAALAKRGYVQHTPYLLRGAVQHQNIPGSRVTVCGGLGQSQPEQVIVRA